MTGVNRWTAAALTAAFLSLALLVAGTSIVQAATIERRAVHKLIKDFPEKTDLSTPESAMAACARSSARNDFQAVLEMSWVKLDTQLAKEIEYGLMHDPNVRRDIGPLFLQIEIIEVLTYHDDLAAVICKGGLPGEGPYGAMPMGKINGVWKILSLFPLDDSDRKLTARSARGAAEGFEKVKDDLWRTFVGVRNEVKAGRTVVYDAKRLAASGAPAKCRVVHKLVKDFPERTDLSTPESAMAACARSLARNDFRAVIEISWVKLDAQKAEFIEHCLTYDPTMPKNHGPLYLDDEIIEVLTYHDDLATVICKGSLPGETPYRTTPMGKINGVWKILSLYPLDVSDRNLTARSAQGAVESFEKDKDALWRRFVEIRNDVRNGRTPVSKFNSKSPPGSLSAAETPVLSAAEKEEMERSEREAWQMSIHLDMPSLEPQAVQFAIRDNDPVPDFMAMAKRMQSYSRQQLRQAGNEARKEQLRGIEMAVWWNLGFKKVTGDGVHLLTNLSESRFAESRHGIMSNSPGGRKWVVTKTVYIEGKPVCWCIPVVVTTGKKIDVTFNNSNTFDLRAVYDNAMWEPAGVGAR